MEYRIIRSRRKTIAIQITPSGEVLVRCPARMPRREIHTFVDSRRDWIQTHLPKEPLPPPLTEAELTELTRQAKQKIPFRTAYFAEMMGVRYGRISIRHQHTRWGSCSSAGNLNFNCLLMLTPDDVLDYVIVHELCHRKEMNHSPRFWAQVEAVLPDYRNQKQWLAEHGAALLSRLPQSSAP